MRRSSELFGASPELNITPMVDIMLVLMAILMITAPVVTYDEKINLPKGSKSAIHKKSKPLKVSIDAKRVIRFDKRSYKFINFADDFVTAAASFSKTSRVDLFADSSLPYGDIIFVLKSIKAAGFTKVSLVTQ